MRRIAFFFASSMALLSSVANVGAAPIIVGARPVQHMQLYTIALPGGKKATVYADGRATIESGNGATRTVENRVLSEALHAVTFQGKSTNPALLDRRAVMIELMRSPYRPFVPGRVVVVFSDNVTAQNDVIQISGATMAALKGAHTDSERARMAPEYTTDANTNAMLAQMGVDRVERVARGFDRGRLHAMVSQARARTGQPLLDIGNAYRLHTVNADVEDVAAHLRSMTNIFKYAEPDYTVSSMMANGAMLPEGLQHAQFAYGSNGSGTTKADPTLSPRLPGNIGLLTSETAFLNATGVDAVAAYDEIQGRFGQLPGQGEIITNVSIGDVDNDSDLSSSCALDTVFLGPTAKKIGDQQYLDWPSLPLIPAYVADAAGNLSGSAQVCNVDPQDGEIGLDFSVMAPLPNTLQRPGENASGGMFRDILGIAPGASYRLVVPGSFGDPGNSDIIGALLGASQQLPAPNVITASLGFGLDGQGFPGRYLEDDSLTRSAIATIVNTQNIVVCIAANDGLRVQTNAAVSPSGGAALTNLAASPADFTNLGDISDSTAPSFVPDTGAIDVGAVTLDDIFSANPQDPRYASLANNAAFAETRWNGVASFASGNGSRVNVSAPGDGILAYFRVYATNKVTPFDSVALNLNSGTSASAPEVAAAAAVLLQVGRLTGHPLSPNDVRTLLASTGRAVPSVPQADRVLSVGPEIDLTHAVEALLKKTGAPMKPGVARVAVSFRQGGLFDIGGIQNSSEDTMFLENVDRTNIDLRGPLDSFNGNVPTDFNARSYITIAPDWEGLPAGTTCELVLASNPKIVLSRGPSTRMLATTLLTLGGGTVPSSMSQTISLKYLAMAGNQIIVSAPVTLTFGPVDRTSQQVLAPLVPPVVNITPGAVIPVRYDISKFPNANEPLLMVSEPGRTNLVTGAVYFPILQVPLSASKGEIDVPVSQLHGGGIYGIQVLVDQISGTVSDLALTRVTAGEARASAPLLAPSATTRSGHFLRVPEHGSFVVAYDVSNVPGATGAIIEFAAPGVNNFGSLFTVANPNGSQLDRNTIGTGTPNEMIVPNYSLTVSGTRGTATIQATSLVPAETQNVRVIPTQGTAFIGEASDVSTVAVDGIVPANGLGVTDFQYDVEASAPGAGIFSVTGTLATGATISAIDVFDPQTDKAVEAISAQQGVNYQFPRAYGDVGWVQATTPSGNLFPTNSSLVSALSITGGSSVFAPGRFSQHWTPPTFPSTARLVDVFGVAPTHGTTTGAFLLRDISSNDITSFNSDVTTSVSSQVLDVSAALATIPTINPNPAVSGFDQIPSLNQAYMLVDSQGAAINNNPNLTNCASISPQIVVMDFSKNTVTSFNAGGENLATDLKVDTTTGIGAFSTLCTTGKLQIVDLVNQKPIASVDVFGIAFIAVDEVNHRFLVECDNSIGFDNNPMQAVLVFDEQGHLISQTPRLMNLFFEFRPLTIDGALHRGFYSNSTFTQLHPFAYSP